MHTPHFPGPVFLRWLALLALALGASAAFAQQEVDPPARVAALSQVEGSVAFAPAGETDWGDAVLNRPITRGDRLWTDRGSRAELHLGSAVMHLDGQTFLEIADLDDDVLRASLNEGSVSARVRELARGENFEIDTPQLAFRAARPGDYRIDVDPAQGTTRVTVRGGTALVYGAGGQAQELAGGQVVIFRGTELERVAVHASLAQDEFDRWAADRNRAEDQSIAARHVPRDVVGYHQLDPYGHWAQDASYGAVWYPQITIADWAPYRYGHWEFIAPWGWTWIDDAPWGFAPFHYGRWAMIGSRWAWVPGRLGPRPVYAPALVMFVGGSGGVSFSLSIGSDPGIGWFPLGPGEAWRPFHRTSPRYVTGVNRYIVIDNRVTNNFYLNQRHPSAVTAVRVEDFSRGRPVHRHWRRVDNPELGRVRIAAQPALPEPRRIVESRPTRQRTLPPPSLSAGPTPVQPGPGFPGLRRRDGADGQRPPLRVTRPQPGEPERVQERAAREQERVQERGADRDPARAQRDQERARRDLQVQPERVQRDQPVRIPGSQDEPRRQQQERAAREQERASRDQERVQREQERARRDLQVQQERMQREQLQIQRQQEGARRDQQVQMQRRQDEQRRQQQVQREQDRAARQQERVVREQERARRDQQVQQERVQREHQMQAQERAQRQQQAAQEHAIRKQQQAQERAQRQQQAAQEQAARQQQQIQQRAMRQVPPPQAAPNQPQQPPREARGRARPEREQRDDGRSQGGEEGGRGRGRGG